MIRLYNKYKNEGLGILGISLDTNRENWKSATETLNIPWTQMSDLNGWNSEAAKIFNVQSIPYTIVTDSNGTILRKGLRGKELEDFIKSQLN